MAVAVVVLVAGALAGIGIARSGSGPAQPQFTLVSPIPPVTAADAALAGPAAGTTTLQASLTGIAAAGKTVVAIGTEPSQPGPLPLFLFSADGGHTWSRAALAGPGAGGGGGTGAVAPPGGPAGPGLTTGPAPAVPAAGGPGAGTAPVLIARSGGTWLALGQHVAWTSPDGRIWRPAPGLPPVAGDTVLGLAGTGSGFVAVGENTGAEPGPVVWTWSAGRAWARRNGPGLGLTAHGGHATALRWAAAANGVVVAGGPVTGAAGQGRRPEAGLWRSTNGGLTWKPVTLPAGHGATAGLAGLAAGGTGFVAVRPGHAAGRQDAVTYQSAQGSTWRYAGKLIPVRQTSLQVTTVSGGGHGFVVAATIHASQVAFFSARGRGWQQTPDPGTGVAGLTAGPGGTVVVAGNSQSGTGAAGMRPHLLRTGPGTGRQQVGQAALAAAATPDATVNGLATGGRTLVAAGASGGSPALWLASAGRWAPAGVLLPGAWRHGALTSVVHGAQGWLAIGQATAPAPRGAGPPAASDPDIGGRNLLGPGVQPEPARGPRGQPRPGGGRPGRLCGGRQRPGPRRPGPGRLVLDGPEHVGPCPAGHGHLLAGRRRGEPPGARGDRGRVRLRGGRLGGDRPRGVDLADRLSLAVQRGAAPGRDGRRRADQGHRRGRAGARRGLRVAGRAAAREREAVHRRLGRRRPHLAGFDAACAAAARPW